MIFFSFVLALIALFLQVTVFPELPILPFIPFLAFISLVCPFKKAVGLAILGGCMIDVLSNDPLGIHALNYVLCLLICFRFKTLFSAESPLHLGFYAAIYSFASTQLQIALLFLFDRRVEFLGKWWLLHWISLPVFDALFAFIWFASPLALYRTIYRKWIVFWLKKKSTHLSQS